MIYSFCNCILDKTRHELVRDGKTVHVEPQVFDLLVLFLENPGQLITKEYLVDVIWHGLSVSDSTISARMNAARKAVGDNGKDQKIIKTVVRRGFQFTADIGRSSQGATTPTSRHTVTNQDIRFVTSSDGVNIAYARSGNGPALIRVGHWLSHLDLDWQSPVWRPFLQALATRHTLYRYDQRGTGLSSRQFPGAGIEEFVDDMSSVIQTTKLDKVPIFAVSQAVPVAIAFAARFPDRVSKLVLYGGYAEGRAFRAASSGDADEQTILSLIRSGWGQPEHTFAKAFSSLFMPDGTTEQIDSFTKMQRESASPDNAVKLRKLVDRFMVRDLLPQIKAPTLILHSRGDVIHPIEQGRILASEIPDARFVMLDSNNHVPLPQDPACQTLLLEIDRFLHKSA